LEYLECVIKETLRVNSPVQKLIPREKIVKKDIILDNLVVKSGTNVELYLMTRN
jgi:cytochrome P450